MSEQIVRFGPGETFVGIHTPSSGTDAAKSPESGGPRPTVVLLNAGLVHRVGPHRLSVEVARDLAASGFDSFRFDLSGIGDSPSRRTASSSYDVAHQDKAIADVRAALDHLCAKTNSERFVLIGLCNGAFNAHDVAVTDERVAGCVFLDGYGYKTPGFLLHHYGPRMLSASRHLGFLRRKILGKKPANEVALDPRAEVFELDFPPKEKVARELGALAARGTELLFVYTGGIDYFNHKGQFDEMFGEVSFGGRAQVEFYQEADHTYTVLSARARLKSTIKRWMLHRFHPNGG